LARRRKKPDRSQPTAQAAPEPRAPIARPSPLEQQRAPATDAVRRTLAHLAEVERLAQIGSWQWDVVNDVVTWSVELCRMLGIAAAPERSG
jgi:hypothetical protein